MYDSKIARWLIKDPAGQYNSPYVSMGNDPINKVDPPLEKGQGSSAKGPD